MATSLVNTLFVYEGEVVSEQILSSRPDLSSPFLPFLPFAYAALVLELGDDKTVVLTLFRLCRLPVQILSRREGKEEGRDGGRLSRIMFSSFWPR